MGRIACETARDGDVERSGLKATSLGAVEDIEHWCAVTKWWLRRSQEEEEQEKEEEQEEEEEQEDAEEEGEDEEKEEKEEESSSSRRRKCSATVIGPLPAPFDNLRTGKLY